MLSFISRVIAFLLFSAEAGETHGHFVDMVAYKITKSKNADNTEYCRVLVVYPYDHVAERELWHTAAFQNHKRVLYSISLA